MTAPVQQQIAVITLGVADLARSMAFYASGFGWAPVFVNAEIAFFQMNGMVLGLWLRSSMEDDVKAPLGQAPGATTIAHNVTAAEEVDALMARLVESGADVLRPAGNPPHGGRRGYIADPDGHVWEIAWNPLWPIDADGHVRFKL